MKEKPGSKIVMYNWKLKMSNHPFLSSGSQLNDSEIYALSLIFESNNNITTEIMTLKTSKTIYWIGAALTSLWFGTSGICELTTNKLVWDITLKLGYPPYFIYVLGVAKVLGIAVLLTPNRLLRLKEWVFAGVFFDIIFAFFSKLIVIGAPATIDAIIAFTIVTVTYVMFRKVYAVTYIVKG